MLVLVTGGTGFLGPSVVERLIAHGHRSIRCLVRPSANLSKLERLRRLYPEAKIEFVTGTLNDPASAMRCVTGVDVVYHLAAGTSGGHADIFMNTVIASRNLLDAIVARRIPKVVLTSSLAVYGVASLPRKSVVNEATPIEAHPEMRDAYAFGKLRQERLFHEYQQKAGFQLVVLRPGVIYGPGNRAALFTRIGLRFPGFFMHLGGANKLPITYVDNCAEAIAVAGDASHPTANEIYNVHDDDLPSCGRYLKEYRKHIEKMRTVRMPFWGAMTLARFAEWYNKHSRGQLPAFLTRYKSANLWKGNRFDNSRLKTLGWKQIVPLEEGLRRTFAAAETTA